MNFGDFERDPRVLYEQCAARAFQKFKGESRKGGARGAAFNGLFVDGERADCVGALSAGVPDCVFDRPA